MKNKTFLLIVFCFSFLLNVAHSAVTPERAMNFLMKGNARFIKNKSISPNTSEERRKDLLSGQSPIAIIVTCSDSRVVPDIIFDQGLGDLFVIRVAGNVVGPLEMESILFAVDHLHTPCVIVMGHENCGAVDAVVKRTTDDVRFLAQLIEPAVQKARDIRAKNILETAIKFNAEGMSEFISQSPSVVKLLKQRKIIVKAAYYDLDKGSVEILK